jgi:AraC-like DNA-binding protein
MLDTLALKSNKTCPRYPTFSDAAIGSGQADLARTRPLAKERASGSRTANDPAKPSANRRSIARHSDQAEVRSAFGIDGPSGTLEPLSRLTMIAQEELTRFYNIVCHAGYELRLRNDTRSMIDGGSNPTSGSGLIERQSERSDGSQRPLEKHRDQRTERSRPPRAHAADRRALRTRCGSRPGAGTSAATCEVSVFDPAGNLVGSLELLPADLKQPVPVDRMTRALLRGVARAIEERLFRHQYRREWIVMVRPEEVPGSGVLLAVDRCQNVVAADRHARSVLAGIGALEAIAAGVGMSLWTLFEKDLALFRSKDRRDIPAQLMPAGTAETWSALITPPDSDLTPWRELDASLHTRPRLGEIGCIRQLTRTPVARGGLSPSVLRRVCEYIDANLETNIGLDAISKVAGLSRCHFVRAFRQSVGTTPHNFLMYRRFRKAVDFITSTDLSLAEIALAAGFSDQSHFSRRFRQYLGVSPSAFRRSQR